MGGAMQMYQQHAPCGSKFSIRFMSFTKEDFVFIKKKWGKIAHCKSDIWSSLRTRSKSNIVNRRKFKQQNCQHTNEARLDIRVCGVWERRQQPFLRVSDPNSCRYLDKSLKECHIMNELEKTRAYNERISQIEHDSFTPSVFSV